MHEYIYIILIIYHDYGIKPLILVTMSKTMNIIIILILIMCEFINHIIIIAYLLYFIQLHFLFQHTYALVPGLKNGQINTMVNTSSIYNPGTPYQYKNGTTETISPIPSSPDRYIPPPPLPSSTPSSTQLPPSIIAIPKQSHSASNIYINPILPVPQQTLTTTDIYIPPPKFLQFSPNISNFTMFNYII